MRADSGNAVHRSPSGSPLVDRIGRRCYTTCKTSPRSPVVPARVAFGSVSSSNGFSVSLFSWSSPWRPARILQGCQRNWSRRADRLCAAGSNKVRRYAPSAASSALRCWRGSSAPSGSARIADAGARWLRRCNDHAAVHWYCRSARRFPAHHRAFYTGAFREPLATGTVSRTASWPRSGMLGSSASSRVALLWSANFCWPGTPAVTEPTIACPPAWT